ncbi:MAG: hypothetical protein WA373_01950, partial [Burkholderiales bacterium]
MSGEKSIEVTEEMVAEVARIIADSFDALPSNARGVAEQVLTVLHGKVEYELHKYPRVFVKPSSP